MRESVPFIKTTRGDLTETVHRISIVAVKDNVIIYSQGNPDLISPIRSTAKPFMITPLLNLAKEQGINLSDSQISVMASSHNGEQIHRECVRSILDMSGYTLSELHCGSHLPYYSWIQDEFFKCANLDMRQLFHNCSGKHAGMLLLCRLLKEKPDNYWHSEHPLQKIITNSVKEHLSITDQDTFHIRIDGCGTPTYAITLEKLAKAYQNFSNSNSLKNVYNALLNEPYMLAGKERIDTLIISELGFVAKSGSDGLFCVSCPKQNIGIALKVESGNDDAAEAAIVEVLDQIGLLPDKVKRKFDDYRFLEINTSTGRLTGRYSPIN